MALSFKTQVFFGAFLLVTLLSGAIGHSYVTSPQSRSNQAQTNAGCRGPSCLGPCEIPLSARRTNAAVHVAKRGDSITVQWPRNNHAGGFIRFAWAPTAQSDNATYFDNHVQQINCHEVGGCHPDDASNPNGGDSGPADGSSRACSSTLKVPADLADGAWTLQWSWFGGAFSLGDYYSCVDYSIAGGNSGSTPAPVFVGGDYSFPNQNKCKYFNTDRLHVCVNEPCTNPIYKASAQQSGPPAYVQLNYNGAPALSSTSATVAAPATTGSATPQTTGAAKPSTTGAAKPSTTGAVAKPSSTTGAAPKPSTTGSVAKPSTTTTTGASTPVSPPTSSCTSGHMKCLSQNTFSTCNFGAWGVSQSCASGTSCSSSGDYIYCLNSLSPTPSTPTTPTTPTTPSTPSTSTSGSSSESCTLGYQKCVGSNAYSTCGNGADGPTWSAQQSCQTGLSCHLSSTANNIYCY